MTYTVGVGALLVGEAFNTVRLLEVAAASATSNFGGLDQPPHVTVKRPFNVSSLDGIQKIQSTVATLAAATPAFDIQYNGIDAFGDKTLYLSVEQPNEALSTLHSTLLLSLKEQYMAEGQFEGKDMVFHTSLATGLYGDQLELSRKKVNYHAIAGKKVNIYKLGVFLGLDNTRWVVISEHALG